MKHSIPDVPSIFAFLRREVSRGISHSMRFAGSSSSLTEAWFMLPFPVGVEDARFVLNELNSKAIDFRQWNRSLLSSLDNK